MDLTEKNIFRIIGELYKTPPLYEDPSLNKSNTSTSSSFSSSSSSAKSSRSSSSPRPSKGIRKGGVESFSTMNTINELLQQESFRCYRVLTYKENSKSNNILVDILTGKLINSGTNRVR